MLPNKLLANLSGDALRLLKLYSATSVYVSKRFASPRAVYEQKVKDGALMPDKDQKATAQQLEDLYNSLQNYKPSPVRSKALNGGGFFGNLFGEKPKSGSSVQLLNTASPRGLYIYGSVGGGKTTLMDMFYECCTNVSALNCALLI